MIIEVTQEDINSGEKEHYKTCPIALAIRRQMNTDDVSVGSGLDHFKYRSSIHINGVAYRHTNATRKFARDFDFDKHPVKPFKFRLIKEK